MTDWPRADQSIPVRGISMCKGAGVGTYSDREYHQLNKAQSGLGEWRR